MNKVISQGAALLLSVILIFFLFSRIDYAGFFRVGERMRSIEKELGGLLWESIEENEVLDGESELYLDSLVSYICDKNAIDYKRIKVHVMNDDEVNAYALLDGHLCVNTGLIRKAESQQELMAVIAHELAHIELNHVMKNLKQKFGIGVLTTVVGGNSEMMYNILNTLTGASYSRKLEKEADMTAVTYLSAASINPIHLAHFLETYTDSDDNEYLEYLSTHPDVRKRIRYITQKVEETPQKYEDKDVIRPESWNSFQEQAGNSIYTLTPVEVRGDTSEGGVDERTPERSYSVEPSVNVEVGSDYIYENPEKLASFPGGGQKMTQYISKHLEFGEEIYAGTPPDKIYLQLVVEKNGGIGEIKFIKGIPDCRKCEWKIVEMLKSMPKWVPAKNNNTVVRSYYNLPITIHLK